MASSSLYAGWIRRAERFVRDLNHLPGQWGVSIAIEPPVTAAEVDALAQSLSGGLPHSLRELYSQGASRCECTYHWTPRQEDLPGVFEVFPDEMSLGGGPAFMTWSEFRDELPRWSSRNLDAARIVSGWQRTIPFIHVANGDWVALQFDEVEGALPVVYLSHEDSDEPVKKLSASFDQFLADWEDLGYVGPEISLLAAFLVEGEGLRPSAYPQKVRRWRDLLRAKLAQST